MHPSRLAAFAAVSAILVAGGTAARAATPPAPTPVEHATTAAGWRWPVEDPRIVVPFAAPPHRYGPGHRGVDVAAVAGDPVSSPADGTIAFAGSVAGRGVVTIDHGDGLVTTLEPVRATSPIGSAVRAGETVAVADAGGHAAAGTVHFGVREHGEYINPLTLYGEVPRAVLLPCC